MDQMDHNSKEELPQFLRDLKKKDSGYRLPNDYFAKMQANVLDQVIEKETVSNMVFLDNLKTWYQLVFKPQYGFIGLAVIVLMVSLVVSKDSTTATHSFSTLNDDDLEYFIDNEINDINHVDLMATLSADEVNINDIPMAAYDVLNTIPDQYIEDLDNTSLIDFSLED